MIELHGNDIIYGECSRVEELKQIISLVHLVTHSKIFEGSEFIPQEEVSIWQEEYA
jgi:hypothetical protein